MFLRFSSTFTFPINSDQIKTMSRCDNENKRELEWVQFSIHHTVHKSITVIDVVCTMTKFVQVTRLLDM